MTNIASANAAASNPSAELRIKIEQSVRSAMLWPAVRDTRKLLNIDSRAGTLRFLSRTASNAAAGLGLKPLRVGLLSSFSIEFVQDAVKAHGFANGMGVDTYQSSFGQFRQEILDPSSGLYAYQPTTVLFAVEASAFIPALASSSQETLPSDFTPIIERLERELRELFAKFRERSGATLLVHNFSPPQWPHSGIRDGSDLVGESALIQEANTALRKSCASITNCYIVDCAALSARFGGQLWRDERMRLMARAPIAQSLYGELAREYVKFFRAQLGLTKKCLVLDLDNTLWGGVIGEDGLAGIKLGTEYPGNAFVEFQHYVLRLQRRGVLLAVASKNNLADAQEVFAQHPSMILKTEHISCWQVGWESKSLAIANIAKQLNIGIEHIVFVDDSGFECTQVEEALPAVTVIQLPSEASAIVAAVARDGWFDSTSFSNEDMRRGELYKQRDQAEALRGATTNLEDFYRDLQMQLAVREVDATSLPRAAQLTQKTNQFNVTTKRYSEADVTRMLAADDYHVRVVTVSDRFGDHGIVGVVIARAQGGVLAIDTLLLSCRVIGRTIETALLAGLFAAGLQRGCQVLRGTIVPSAKNAPVRDLFERHAFRLVSGASGETQVWERDLSGAALEVPEWFQLHSA